MSNNVHKCSTSLKNAITWCTDKIGRTPSFLNFFLDLSQFCIYGIFTDNVSVSISSLSRALNFLSLFWLK